VNFNGANLTNVDFASSDPTNAASDVKINSSEVIWVNSWAPIHNGTKPSLHDAFSEKLKNSLNPIGQFSEVTIIVMCAGFFMGKNYADDLLFVNT